MLKDEIDGEKEPKTKGGIGGERIYQVGTIMHGN